MVDEMINFTARRKFEKQRLLVVWKYNGVWSIPEIMVKGLLEELPNHISWSVWMETQSFQTFVKNYDWLNGKLPFWKATIVYWKLSFDFCYYLLGTSTLFQKRIHHLC